MPSRRPGKKPPQSTNTATGHAHIGVQGIVNGDVRYEVSQEDPPKKKYSVAKNCLAGNMPRRAEELIKEIVQVNFISNEVAYYWGIAVLSDRSFDLLGPEEFRDLRSAYQLTDQCTPDDWQKTLHLVVRLVDHLLEQERTGDPDPKGLEDFIRAYDQLQEDRRDEIRRHLDLILTGGIQDRLDANFAEDVRRERVAENRADRVWKFFMPVPEPPRPIELREPALDRLSRTMVIGGAALGGTGLLLAFVLAAPQGIRTATVAAVLICAGAYVVCRFGPTVMPERSLFRSKQPKVTGAKFKRDIHESVQRQFEARAPKALEERSRWSIATFKIKATLVEEIVDLYGEPKIDPGAIDWLIRSHAEETARQWSDGELESYDHALSVLAFLAGSAVLGYGVLRVLSQVSQVRASIAVVVFIWLAGAFLLLAQSRIDVHLVKRRTYPADRATAQQRIVEEKRAYRAWLDVLDDRPTDAEMVRWLGYDKIYLKTLAMNQYGLVNREIIAHAILAVAAPDCRRARARNGPMRFSAYTVWVFLLTDAGVRQVAVDLDFSTGISSNQKRMTFRYDAIAASRVVEVGIRFDDGRREAILPGVRKKDRKPDVSKLIFHQVFQLSLIDGGDIEIVVEDLNEWHAERTESEPDPASVEVPDTSDLAGALRILEAVAADGREWIAQARTRRRQRLLHESQDHWNADGRLDGILPRMTT